MKFLRRMLDRVEPMFEEGGKFAKFYPAYEAMDTFLFSPPDVTKVAPHVRDALDLKRMMIMVVAALAPCTFMAMYNTGLQANLAMEGSAALGPYSDLRNSVMSFIGLEYNAESFLSNLIHGALFFLPVYTVCMAVGGTWEMIFSVIRKHEINEGFLVTGLLFPLTLPPTIPLWQVALGVSFGIVLGKEVFGGTGKNFLNPALTARAFLYFAYPAQISGDRVWTAADGFSGATPLGALANADPTALAAAADVNAATNQVLGVDWWDAFYGFIQGSMGETSTLACLIGAIILIATGIGSWRIMAAVLAGGMGTAALFCYGIGSETNSMFFMTPMWHLVTGGFAFGLVFMATDPVSASMTSTGKWFYGGLIGVMTVLIRVINPAYPEGIMLAILFGNVFAPLIDYFVVQANIKRRLARSGT
jgi:Na+-transporting NADH:ubiquinone oxidoreductase subunit B